jgi:hypothetical protein
MTRGRLLMMATILALPAVFGCYQARITNTDLWFFDVPAEVPADPGTPDVPPVEVVDVPTEVPADVPGDVPTDVPLPDKDRATGSPCTTDDQCWTLSCLTTEFLKLLNPNLEAPGGMCSMIGCSADEDCGPGGKCADANAVSAGFPKLCVKVCATDADCGRAEYGCPDLGVVDTAGGKLQGCLPLKLVELLLCDNKTCDKVPKDPYCPETCPQ